ncbi:MAG: hypothetical protein P8176_13090 [Gammaproteobacteria bacterium]
MNKILAIIDAHDASLPALQQAIIMTEGLPQSAQVSESDTTDIVALHPVYDLPAQIEKIFHGTLLNNLTQPIIANAEQWLNQVVTPFQSPGNHIQQSVMWSSHAFEAILKKCQEASFDLIIKKIDPHSRWTHFLFHSDDWHVLSQAPTEVLMISEPLSFNNGTLMVALESNDPKHDALNHRLLTRAKQLQTDWNMKVVVVHAYPNITGLPSYGIDGGYYLAPEVMEEIVASHRQSTDTLLASFAFQNLTTLVEPGPPAFLIQEKVSEIQPTCLMVGNLHNKGIPNITLHKPYDKLAANVACALWVVPDQKKTP